jgi:hypothetical protein
MNVHDYLIDCSAVDWIKLTETWRWRLPRSFTAWLMNRFGDLYLKTDDGKIHVLRLDDGSLSCLADSSDEFCEKIDDGEIANDWLMIPLVDRLVAAGKLLGPNECYAFVQFPLIGGDYTADNVQVRTIAFQYAALVPIFEQMADLPDGTKVEFKLKAANQTPQRDADSNSPSGDLPASETRA